MPHDHNTIMIMPYPTDPTTRVQEIYKDQLIEPEIPPLVSRHPEPRQIPVLGASHHVDVMTYRLSLTIIDWPQQFRTDNIQSNRMRIMSLSAKRLRTVRAVDGRWVGLGRVDRSYHTYSEVELNRYGVQ